MTSLITKNKHISSLHTPCIAALQRRAGSLPYKAREEKPNKAIHPCFAVLRGLHFLGRVCLVGEEEKNLNIFSKSFSTSKNFLSPLNTNPDPDNRDIDKQGRDETSKYSSELEKLLDRLNNGETFDSKDKKSLEKIKKEFSDAFNENTGNSLQSTLEEIKEYVEDPKNSVIYKDEAEVKNRNLDQELEDLDKKIELLDNAIKLDKKLPDFQKEFNSHLRELKKDPEVREFFQGKSPNIKDLPELDRTLKERAEAILIEKEIAENSESIYDSDTNSTSNSTSDTLKRGIQNISKDNPSASEAEGSNKSIEKESKRRKVEDSTENKSSSAENASSSSNTDLPFEMPSIFDDVD